MIKVPDEFINPPDIFAWLKQCFTQVPSDPFPRVRDLATFIYEQTEQSPQVSGYKSCKQTRLLIQFFNAAFTGEKTSAEDLVSCMAEEGFTLAQLNSLPFGLALPLLDLFDTA
jgi:hypothetical protein